MNAETAVRPSPPDGQDFEELKAKLVGLFDQAQAQIAPQAPPVSLAGSPVAQSPSAPPPPPGPRKVPPPPPPPTPSQVWADVTSVTPEMDGDRIEAFAPAPQMDWGPSRASLFQRLRARKSA